MALPTKKSAGPMKSVMQAQIWRKGAIAVNLAYDGRDTIISMLTITLFTLLHLLVFAYWLGGDIGVFYASTLLTDDKRDDAGRMAAAKILNDVDLAPRICLLLALPTGLALAVAKGWLALPAIAVGVIFLLALLWVGLVLRLHVDHGGAQAWKNLDFLLRTVFLAVLASAGIAGLAGALDLPLFISLKLMLLAFAVAMGLLVRRVLAPFGPAFAKLATEGADPETNRIIKNALGRARPAVVAIWMALGAAAWLGIAAPA